MIKNIAKEIKEILQKFWNVMQFNLLTFLLFYDGVPFGVLNRNCVFLHVVHHTDRSNENGTLTNKPYWNEGTLNGDEIH